MFHVIFAVCAFLAGGVIGWSVTVPLAERFGTELRLGTVARLLVTCVVAIAWAMAAYRFGWSGILPAVLGFVMVGVALAVVDAREKRLPLLLNWMLTGLVVLGLGFAWIFRWLNPLPVLGAAIGAAILVVLFFIAAVLPMRVLGMGDVWLALPVGLLLGWLGFGPWIVGVLLAAVFAGLVALVSVRRGAALTDHVPFGPALLAATFLAALIPS